MSRKLKRAPGRLWTARNLLIAHLTFHLVFVYGYWSSIVDVLGKADLDFLDNHMFAVLAGALSNHFFLVLLLIVHAVAMVASKWWTRRQRRHFGEQGDVSREQMSAEEKLELILDEVVDLREALHEANMNNGVQPPRSPAGRLQDDFENDGEYNDPEEQRSEDWVLQP